MSASVVEYEGFLASGAVSLSPTLRYDAPNFSLGALGSWTVFESGNRILQATGAAAWLSPPHDRLRFELSGAAGASRYADQPGSGHALARARFHVVSSSVGGWAGASTGALFDGPAAHPVEVEVGAWTAVRELTLVGTLTRASVGGNRHVDLFAAARYARGRLELETRLGARPWADSDGDIGEPVAGAFGEVSALLSLGTRVAITLAAGSYPSDPARRVLAARYLTAGLRLALLPPSPTPIPPLTSATLAAARARVLASERGAPRLEIGSSGELRRITVHAPDARSVELMADFTDWQPVQLGRGAGGVWHIELPVSPGVHRLNVRVNGGEWLVPEGARPETGEFGDQVGIFIVR